MERTCVNKPLCVSLLLLLAATACSFGSSPTATFKGFIEAQKNKDVAGMKKRLSKKTLTIAENSALAQKKTIDEAIAEGFPAATVQKSPEMRNEKITGDSGTLEVQFNGAKDWQTIYFGKEDGDWKIALDRTIEEMGKKPANP